MSRSLKESGAASMESQDKIWVVTTESFETRAPGDRLVVETELRVEQLSGSINLFLGQLDSVLRDTPKQVGKFQLTEFELYAEVSTDGTLKVLGTGIGVGAMGGLKFKFCRTSSLSE